MKQLGQEEVSTGTNSTSKKVVHRSIDSNPFTRAGVKKTSVLILFWRMKCNTFDIKQRKWYTIVLLESELKKVYLCNFITEFGVLEYNDNADNLQNMALIRKKGDKFGNVFNTFSRCSQDFF